MSQLYIQAFNFGNLWQRGDFGSALAIPAYDTLPDVNDMTSSVRNGMLAVEISTNKLKWYSNGAWYDSVGSGTVTSIIAAYPLTGGTITSSGTIGIDKASSSIDGYLSSGDWTIFNDKQDSGDYITELTGDVTALGPGSVPSTISPNAVTYSKIQDAAAPGILLGSSSSSLNIQEIILGAGLSMIGNILSASGAITTGNLTEATSSVLTITGGTGAVVGLGTTIQVKKSSASTSGYLSNIDWLVFDSKQAAGNYITDLTGDVTANGPGSVGATIANNAVTYAKIQAVSAVSKLLGSSSSSTAVQEISIGSGLTLTGTTLNNTATPTPLGYYGAWQDDNTQSAAANNTGYAMMFHTADVTPNGVSIANNGSGNPTRITFANTGVYNIQFSSQFQNTDTSLHDVNIWLRLNGSDVAGSNGLCSIPNSHGGANGHAIVGWNYVLDVVAGQYYELMWMTDDYTKVTMQYYSAGSPPPATASVILTVTQQSGIMSGTGITAINSLTGAAQTLSTGTLGTNFTISSSGTAHTFNLPSASATKTGKLEANDWIIFNSKQAAGNYITDLTGDITASGPGSVASTLASNLKVGSISVSINGQGSVPATGAFGAVIMPYSGTITNWYLATTADSGSGSIVVDVKISGTSIIGTGNKPTLSSGTSASAAVSGWTSTAITANDIITFNIDSASSLTGVTLMIKITKS